MDEPVNRYIAILLPKGASAELASVTLSLYAADIDEAEATAEEVAVHLARRYVPLEVDSIA